ncbi:aminoglycoside phosphotransferase family protein [Lederbergia galactosidilytica]|uniref:Aminoglycoside phosphotransferase domain-containing protein n=1 Tax=Lederbergia galactosidilytica TaxID=217031 RepID=A0A177ZP74_9BACI|nr:phosphotransferase [Lederbergia galactosidilytica]KRG14871.1 hypothetical protein ACA30_09365 [Virgibacillus soli]OAK69120.1 hypothetical protein ABB05_14230 [Lederbergia galactosidilytica]
MPSFKLDMDIHEATDKLTDLFKEQVTNVTAIEMGELSRVFSFNHQQNEYVIHFKRDRYSFDKAKYMFETYSSAALPIPKLIEIGSLSGMYYAISEKALGQPISKWDEENKVDSILNQLADHFTYMSQIPIDPNIGFGTLTEKGIASQKSWQEALMHFFDPAQLGFHHNWTNLYTISFLEKTLFTEGFNTMMSLAEYSPVEPHLVHGDFHLGNMLSDGQKVTGIVDWEMAMYGDFMFDLAGLHFWAPHLEFPQRVRKSWIESGKNIPYFEERLRCYLLLKGIDGLRFYAKKDDKGAYNYMRNRVIALLKE